jgi:putative oxidoreductase
MDFLQPHADKIYALTRILAGLMFMQHGFQKIFGWFGGAPEGAPGFIVWGAGGIELIGGGLVAAGLFAAPAAFLCSGTMAVAFFMGHVFGPQNPSVSLIPIVNKGELAALYCWVFLVIAAKGAGMWSVDASRAKTA